jgi:hypothetical protein
LSGVYNGNKSFAFNGFPANHKIAYSVCLVLGKRVNGALTSVAAGTFANAAPTPQCATQAVP